MEKLIELLNEYETPQSGVVFKSYDNYDGTFYGVDIDGETEIARSDSFICGKRFGFIKWLVENEKIDREKVKEKSDRIPLLLDKVGDIYNCGVLKSVLMLLAISDTPIDDLIYYLK